MAAKVGRWTGGAETENAMEQEHAPLWQRMIDCIVEPSLSDKDVLDYGCNQGGFLRLRWQQKPFRKGMGVDIAAESVANAESRKPDDALSYRTLDVLDDCEAAFDVAFSHEVLYLLPDLAAHAKTMRCVLRPGGSYYAAIGCHTDNPFWENWKKLIAAYSAVPVQTYAPEDYLRAFDDQGFSVSVRPFMLQDFIPVKPDNAYMPRVVDSIHYHTQYKLLFRFAV